MNIRAVRAFNRLWAPKARAMQMAQHADAGFDGGEWSGPWHSKRQAKEYYATLDLVASRYGLTRQRLEADVMERDLQELDKWLVGKRI